MRKGYRLVTNNPWFTSLQLKCADVEAHHHESIQGSSHGETMTKYSSPYVRSLCARYAQLTKAGYDRGAKAACLAITRAKLKDLTLAWTPKESPELVKLCASGSVAPTAGPRESTPGASSSVTLTVPLVPGRFAPILLEDDMDSSAAVSDYWIETASNWIRYHVTPRSVQVYPGSVLEASSLSLIHI